MIPGPARVAFGDKGEDVHLSGVTKFTDSNKFNVAGDEDKGEMGLAAVKFFGGVKGGFQALRPPAPKLPDAGPAGRPAVVTLDDKMTRFVVADLLALYRCADGTERLLPVVLFKKTLKVDVTKVKKIGVEGKDTWQVTFKDGEEQDRKRRLREEILLGNAHGSVSNAEVGEPGCTRWTRWFRLVVSGGCP